MVIDDNDKFEEFIPKEEALRSLNECLRLLSEPTITFKQRCNEGYIRRMMDGAKKCILKKIFGYDDDIVEPHSVDSEIVTKVRKVHSANSEKAVQSMCLQILPTDWPMRKVKDEIPSTSMYSIRKARSCSTFNSLQGISEEKEPHSEKTYASVVSFYCKDEYSRLMSGKKDCKSVKVNLIYF